ncbi:hypothetical protein [Streptomyces sp. cg35]|uniref:hypothetical protein n=1 Tax=Streptomyces sp. cg35 TaxID=3421650 RepID=UPI003D16F0F4
MLRLRIERTTWPRPALVMTDTPRTNCPDCQGAGGHNRDYGDHSGEYAGTDWDPCPCWDETRRWIVLPLPRRPRRPSGPDADPWAPNSSNEPPF